MSYFASYLNEGLAFVLMVAEFSYTKGNHNVAVVDNNGHDSCTVPSGAQIFQTGDDNITLTKGELFHLRFSWPLRHGDAASHQRCIIMAYWENGSLEEVAYR